MTLALHVTNKLAYWHMPKTGGMSVYRIMRELGVCYERIPGPARHGRSHQIPSSALRRRLLFGTVRNPRPWYLSLYQHVASGEDGLAILGQIGNGDTGFRPVLYGLTHPREIKVMPDRFAVVFAVSKDYLDDYLASGLGLCSWIFRYVYGRPPRPEVFLDTSQLVSGMSTLMGLSQEKVADVTPQNKAEHRPASFIPNAQALYDDEMLSWVADADAALIETFGYTEPFGPAREATMDAAELVFTGGLR